MGKLHSENLVTKHFSSQKISLPQLTSLFCSQLKFKNCCYCQFFLSICFPIWAILIKIRLPSLGQAFEPFWQGLLPWASTLDDHTVHGPFFHDHLLDWLLAHSQADWIVSLGHRCQATMALNEQPIWYSKRFFLPSGRSSPITDLKYCHYMAPEVWLKPEKWVSQKKIL